MRNIREQLFFCVLFIVTFTCNTNPSAFTRTHENLVPTFELEPHPMRDTLDSLSPYFLVQLGVKTDIRGAHRFA